MEAPDEAQYEIVASRAVLVQRDADAVARSAAAIVVEAARQALRERGRFALMLAGGNTPRRLYERLAAGADVDWSRVEIFFGDERAVPPEHSDSNYRMAREALLDPLRLDPRRVHRIEAERVDLDAAAHDYEAELARTLGAGPEGAPPRLDVVLLGLGTDGHTASLFPHSRALSESRRWVVANEAPGVGRRITITFPLIERARLVLVVVEGASKADALAGAIEGQGDPERIPAQRLRAARHVSWVVDAAAAARLDLPDRRAP